MSIGALFTGENAAQSALNTRIEILNREQVDFARKRSDQ
jgi:hypothetical protein